MKTLKLEVTDATVEALETLTRKLGIPVERVLTMAFAWLEMAYDSTEAVDPADLRTCIEKHRKG